MRLRTLNTLNLDGSEQAVRVVACWSWRDARGRQWTCWTDGRGRYWGAHD
jgi:hypothetical protein